MRFLRPLVTPQPDFWSRVSWCSTMSECMREMNEKWKRHCAVIYRIPAKIYKYCCLSPIVQNDCGNLIHFGGKAFLISLCREADRRTVGQSPEPTLRACARLPRPAPRHARPSPCARLGRRAAGGWRRAISASLRASCRGAARVGGIVAELPAPRQGHESAMAAAVVVAAAAAAASGPRAAAR